MDIEREDFCPLIKDKCKRQDCNFFIKLRGKNPQTGVPIDEWGCTITWLPMLLVENAKESRQGAAATESFRNMMFELASGQDPNELRSHNRVMLNGS